MKKQNLVLFLSAFLIYLIIDFGYYILIGLSLDNKLLLDAGIIDIYAEAPRFPILFLVFFVLIALANLILVILPALHISIQSSAVSFAFSRGFLLGLTAYATLMLTNTWSLQDYPILMLPIHSTIGGLLSMLSSGLTIRLFWKKYSRRNR